MIIKIKAIYTSNHSIVVPVFLVEVHVDYNALVVHAYLFRQRIGQSEK